mmetsp:Transcript_77261/g.226586  ORF Transcript_77261/g.226586 Transcript_77261/m.226586 type:complete len:345 (-) Transcript_77261:147-1181(-)
MGCGLSKGAAPPPKKGGKDPAAAAAKAAAAERRKNLKPEDFIISKKSGEVIVKAEGTICGEQFNIEECKDCDIFLFDHIATAFVDQCVGCRIFVGPVESSVFLRDCRSCDLVIACQQFRSRDCTECRCALLCTTEPIIETSSCMQFACFDFGYFSLRQQLERAGLKLWNNKWWQIYDFNKEADKSNWELLPQEEASRLLRTDACDGAVSPEELSMERVVPVTLGSRPRPSQESCFALFLPDSDADIEAFLGTAVRTEGWNVCRARSMILSEEQLKLLFGWAKEPKLIASCKRKEVTGIEICGDGVVQQVQETVSASNSRSVRIVPQQETPSLGRSFFDVWKDEV